MREKPKKQVHKPKQKENKAECNAITKPRGDFPIVGIGASAGGLGPAKELFKAIPADIGMAFVFIQHLDPTVTSSLGEIIAGVASLPVTVVSEDVEVEPNHIYVMSPDTCLRLAGNQIKVLSRDVCEDGVNKPIDVFLRSLADQWRKGAMAVILSGMGSDGALGIQAVRAEGGITFAQDEQSALHGSMPASAVATNSIDFILSPSKIAAELASLANHPLVRPSSTESAEAFSNTRSTLKGKILGLVKDNLGLDFSQYKQTTVERRIQRRMVVHKLKSFEEYLRLLQSKKTEIDALCNDILINVTQFFRDPEAFEALKKEVFPKIVGNNHSREPIRIWVPGCSTGEEAYSLMIVLSEFLDEKSLGTEIQLFGSDVSKKVIQKARTAIFPENISLDVSPERLRRFFVRLDNGYQITKSIRDACVFADHNLAKDPPFSKLDIISCRNLLIYFSADLQKQVIPIFHYALNPDGFLLLGSSEGINSFSDMFSCLDKNHKLFAKNITAKSYHFQLPMTFSNQVGKTTIDTFHGKQKKDLNAKEIANRADRFVLTQYGPPGFVVNSNMDMIQIRGNTSRFVELSPGQANFNLQKVVKQELRSPLRALFLSVKSTGVSETKSSVRLRDRGETKEFEIQIVPLKAPQSEQFTYLILFIETPAPASKIAISNESSTPIKINKEERDFEFRQMEEELSETKEHLQNVTEEMETANEELKSSNEELLSSNEELQSTNEELQTASEEIRSSNEELNTLNEELQNRNSEIAKLNDDLLNLLGSTQIAVVMLGRDLRIVRFTPPAEKLLHLIPGDIGRPIRDIRPAIDVSNLEKLAEEVVKHLQPKNIEVQDEDARSYLMQIRPYRTIENKIDGVVITFVDIHDLKLRIEQERHLATIIRDSSDAITAQDLSGKILAWNKGAEKIYGFNSAEALTMNISQIVPEEKKPEALDIIRRVKHGEVIPSFETQRCTKEGSLVDVSLTVTVLTDNEGNPIGVATTERDITFRKRAEKELIEGKKKAEVANIAKSEFLANMSHEIRTPLCAIMGFSEIISSGSCSENDRMDHAQKIIHNAENLKQLIDDILDLSKVEAGKVELVPVEFPLLAELADIFSGLRILAQAKGIVLELDVKDAIPESITSDPGILRQIFMNIIGNAIKFTSKGSVIVQIGYQERPEQKRPHQLEFIVKDTGCGISKDQVQKIFDPFVQGELSSKRKYGGTGLGLSLSTKLAKYLDGRVELIESKPGKGSTFSVTLSPSEASTKLFSAAEASVALSTMYQDAPKVNLQKDRLHNFKILVAEDNADLRQLMGKYLERSGAETDFAENGAVAVQKIRNKAYDVVLMDMAMPEMNGYEATAQLREDGYKGVIIAVSARVMADEIQKCLDVGCNECISKPVNYNALMSIIEKHVKN